MSDYSDDYVNKLQDELRSEKAAREALVEEFKETITNEFSPEDLKKKFKELLPDAYSTLMYLLRNGESESVRAGVAKYIFNVSMGAIKITDANDPDGELKELLEVLTKGE